MRKNVYVYDTITKELIKKYDSSALGADQGPSAPVLLKLRRILRWDMIH